MASFTERVEVREHQGQAHRFNVSDEGDLYVLREMYEMNVYQVEIAPGMKILDIGAHKGIFTTWAAKQGARVTAFEPDPFSYPVLLRNLAENHVEATTFNCGIRGFRAYRPFWSDRENSIGSSFYPERLVNFWQAEPSWVKVAPLDDALENEEWDVVKIDAEQSEYNMLLASEHLDQIKQLTFEWHCPSGQRDCPELYRTIEKLKQFFDVPPIDLNWRALSMRRK